MTACPAASRRRETGKGQGEKKEKAMIKSMTGYGKSQGEIQGKVFQIEIRSVNSKTLDISFKLPAEWRDLEPVFRTRIASVLSRGKIDCSLRWIRKDAGPDGTAYRFNRDQMRLYLKEWQEAEALLRSSGVGETSIEARDLLSLPGIVSEASSPEFSQADAEAAEAAMDECIASADKSRAEEGAVLEKDFRYRTGLIEELACQVEPFEKERIARMRQRLELQLSEWESAEKKVDKNRFEQEMIYYLEKLDITEEKVRLHKHCRYFLQTLEEDMPGRKLAFIAQEMGREINTMGSKANDADIQKLVVRMKDELEKIKEQLFNIL